MAKARLAELYVTKLRPELQEKLGFKNVMQVPRIEKIVLNIGVKEAVKDSRILVKITQIVGNIAGQKAMVTKAHKSIAGFKIREEMPLGVMVTLRGRNMYEFLDRLINIALPNVRDFQGVSTKLDRRGNYNLGIKEWSIFPEAESVAYDRTHGMNITIQTSASEDKSAYALLESFNMPFRKTAIKK